MATSKMKQTGGRSSNNQQAEKIVNNQITIAVTPLEETARELQQTVFGGVPEKTLELIKKNQTTFLDVFSKSLVDVVSKVGNLEEVIHSPDFQYVAKKAMVTASRSDDTDLYENLAILISKRIENDGVDIKRIVFNESLQAIEKITKNHLKIISLCFLSKYAVWPQTITREQLNKIFNDFFRPFLQVETTASQFQYLEYVGCSNHSAIGGRNFFEQFIKRNYPMTLSAGISKEEVDAIGKVQGLISRNDAFVLPFRNVEHMKELLKEKGLTDEQITVYETVLNRMINHRICNGDDEIKNHFDLGNEISELFGKWFGSMKLTAVGIALAISYVEKVTGEKMDVNIWIN